MQVEAAGFRIIDHGPHVTVDQSTGAKLVPTLQDLLKYQDITLSLYDRASGQDGKPVMTLTNVKPVSYNTSVGARGIQEMRVTFMGLYLSDETADQVGESPGAADLPGSDPA